MTARAYKEYMDYCEITQGYFDSGKEEGIAIGEELGRTEAKLEAARNMLLENDSTEKVARCLGLPLEKVRELARFAGASSTETDSSGKTAQFSDENCKA